jgi:UDP-N-acetylmuramoyl-tripeptide--D-alanyl-D-alanine ligase
VLVTVGELGAAIAAEARICRLQTAHDLHARRTGPTRCDLLRRLLHPGDMVLVKGSRAVGMETIVDAIVVNGDHRQMAEDRA